MPRTTLDLDPSVLRRLKARARDQRKSLGAVASELLAPALSDESARRAAPLRWHTHPMRAKVDLEDKEAVRRALERR